MIFLPWIVRALTAAGFDTGWSIIGEEIVNWVNPEPQPTIEELEAILPRD
jgi:hypothetical protein